MSGEPDLSEWQIEICESCDLVEICEENGLICQPIAMIDSELSLPCVRSLKNGRVRFISICTHKKVAREIFMSIVQYCREPTGEDYENIMYNSLSHLMCAVKKNIDRETSPYHAEAEYIDSTCTALYRTTSGRLFTLTDGTLACDFTESGSILLAEEVVHTMITVIKDMEEYEDLGPLLEFLEKLYAAL